MKKSLVLVIICSVITPMIAFAEPVLFKMYPSPNPKVNSNCDMYTELVLDVDGDKGEVLLQERIDGSCRRHVEPNPRSYKLISINSQCGNIYRQDMDAQPITAILGALVDFRVLGADCTSNPPSKILVTEYDDNGEEVKLYSLDK